MVKAITIAKNIKLGDELMIGTKRSFVNFGKMLALFMCFAAGQSVWASELSYSYVEVEYIPTGGIDLDPDVDLDGFGINASYELGDRFFISASYQDGSGDRDEDDEYDALDIDTKLLRVGLGIHGAISENVDWVVSADFARIDLEVSNDSETASADDNGYIVDLGIRGLLADSFEYSAALLQSDIVGSETGFRVGGRYHFGDSSFSIGADYVQYSSDLDMVEIGFRYQFD